MVIFSKNNFKEEVLESNLPVMVDFYADWCSPCRMLSPTVEEIAAEYEGKAKIGKLDTQTNQELAIQYRVSSIPALLFFKDGKLADRIIGLVPKEMITEKLNSFV